MDPLVSRTLSDQVADALRKLILSRSLPPGEPLIESEIAQRLATSRNPVREALRKLEQDGLVVGQAYKGFTVVDLSPKDVKGLYEVRLALERLAVESVVSHWNQEARERLTQAIGEIGQAAAQKDLLAVVDRELAFHDTLCELSGNLQLLETFRFIRPRIHLVLAFDNSAYEDLMDVAKEHEPLLQALADGDVAAAKKMLSDHIMAGMADLISRLEDEANWHKPT